MKQTVKSRNVSNKFWNAKSKDGSVVQTCVSADNNSANTIAIPSYFYVLMLSNVIKLAYYTWYYIQNL